MQYNIKMGGKHIELILFAYLRCLVNALLCSSLRIS